MRLRVACRKLADQSAFTFEFRILDCIMAILHPTSLNIRSEIAQQPALLSLSQLW